MENIIRQAAMLMAVSELKRAYKPDFGYILWRQAILEHFVEDGYLESKEVRTKGRPAYVLIITKRGRAHLRYLMRYLKEDIVIKEKDNTLAIYGKNKAKRELSHKRCVERARERKRLKLKEDRDRNKMADAIIEALQDDKVRELVMDKLRDKEM